MRQTIRGLRYDTDKAQLIAEHNRDYQEDKLYLTPKGKWFLVYLTTQLGQSIEPLTKRQAADWCAEVGREDVIDKYFMDVVEMA